MRSSNCHRASALALLLLCGGFAGLPACASEGPSDADNESSAAAATEEAESSEDVASLDAEGGERLIARAVFGVSKLRDESGKKRVFAHVRYYDKEQRLIAYGVPQARGDKTEFVLVRPEGSVTPQNDADDAKLAEEARVLTEKLVKDVEANGCSVGKGVLRAVGRFIGGLVVGSIGFVITLALSPVYLVILIAEGGEVDSKFVDVTARPYLVGIQLIKGAFKPCRALEPIDG